MRNKRLNLIYKNWSRKLNHRQTSLKLICQSSHRQAMKNGKKRALHFWKAHPLKRRCTPRPMKVLPSIRCTSAKTPKRKAICRRMLSREWITSFAVQVWTAMSTSLGALLRLLMRLILLIVMKSSSTKLKKAPQSTTSKSIMQPSRLNVSRKLTKSAILVLASQLLTMLKLYSKTSISKITRSMSMLENLQFHCSHCSQLDKNEEQIKIKQLPLDIFKV